MTDEEMYTYDATLIARLRERGGRIPTAAADRIEALVKERDQWIERCGRERAFASSHRIRAERLEAALQKITDGYGPNHLSQFARDTARAALDELARLGQEYDAAPVTHLGVNKNGVLDDDVYEWMTQPDPDPAADRIEQLAATNERLEGALKRVLQNVDEDGYGTVLMIDLIHARAALIQKEPTDDHA